MRTRSLCALAGALALAAVAAPAGAHAAGYDGGDDSWNRTIEEPLSAAQLGLPATEAPRSIAQAAIRRHAARLGLGDSAAGVRFLAEQSPGGARAAGARKLHQLRFRQTVGGLRVLYSQIDVAVAGGAASSISATIVPIAPDELRGEQRISPARARAIARERIAGDDRALPAQAVAYAGTPAKPQAPRRAYVVQVTPAAQEAGADADTAICVVVDAETGRVLETWEGIAARAPKPAEAGPGARAAQAAGSTHLLYVDDAKNGGGKGVLYHRRSTNQNPYQPYSSISQWYNGGPGIQALTDLANQAHYLLKIDMCFERNFCGWDGGWDGSYNAHLLTGRTNQGTHYDGSDGRIYMAPAETGQRDILAHEFGHHMDFTYADDRISDTAEADEVEEALADMFSYDLDRTDAILGSPGRINWANPEAIKNPRRTCRTRRRCTTARAGGATTSAAPRTSTTTARSSATPTTASCRRSGTTWPGTSCRYIPWYLSARPRFIDVQRGFATRAGELHGASVKTAALQAFQEVGIPNQDHPGC